MPKKKTTIRPDISSNKSLASKVKRQDVIEVVTDDEDALIDSLANDSGILPVMSETLPVMRKSTDFKVQDPLTLYLKEISKHKLLSPAEEKKLTDELIKTGDIEVAKKLVLANLRLVVKIALEYKNAYKNIMDLTNIHRIL